jgi:hypothetical protein
VDATGPLRGFVMAGLKLFLGLKVDAFVKSRRIPFSVIPAKAGIQYLRSVMKSLDPVFQRGDDFLRSRQG